MTPKPEKNLAVIVVGYNSERYLEDCFTSLLKSTFQNFHIFFVDNHSADGSVALVMKKYADVTILAESENLGFAEGNNRGIRAALEQGFPYILLVNPDTTVSPTCLEELMGEANPTTILQPLILLDENGPTNLVNTAGNVLSTLGFSYCGGYREEAAKFTENTPITVASGAGVLFPAEILKKIGLFDPTFFIYHEDVDLTWRARKAGYELLLIPSAKLWHKYSFSRNNKKFFYSERNRLVFVAKNFGAPLHLLTLPFHIVNEVLLCLYALVSGWLPAKLRSYGSFIGLIPHIARERRALKKITTRSDHDLKALLSPNIQFSEVKIPLLDIYNLFARAYWYAIKWLI